MSGKHRVTVSLDPDLLAYVDSLDDLGPNRSQILEEILRRFRDLKTKLDYYRWCRDYHTEQSSQEDAEDEPWSSLAYQSLIALSDRLDEEEKEWSAERSTKRGSRGSAKPDRSS